jgi:hypothetical protein
MQHIATPPHFCKTLFPFSFLLEPDGVNLSAARDYEKMKSIDIESNCANQQ